MGFALVKWKLTLMKCPGYHSQWGVIFHSLRGKFTAVGMTFHLLEWFPPFGTNYVESGVSWGEKVTLFHLQSADTYSCADAFCLMVHTKPISSNFIRFCFIFTGWVSHLWPGHPGTRTCGNCVPYDCGWTHADDISRFFPDKSPEIDAADMNYHTHQTGVIETFTPRQPLKFHARGLEAALQAHLSILSCNRAGI